MIEPFKNSDRILIVGGTGFIGRHLMKRCLQHKLQVVCLGLYNNPDTNPEVGNAKFLQVDITSQKEMQTALKNESFDYAFNLCGYIDHIQYFAGGRRVIDAHFVTLMDIIDCLDRNTIYDSNL